eukprot:jgi/Mesvir1/9099/Mv03841-RA.1
MEPIYGFRMIMPVKGWTKAIVKAAIEHSSNLHSGVKLWEEKTRRPFAVVARFNSFSSLDRRITFEFVELGTAIARKYHRPSPSQPRVRPDKEFLLLAVLFRKHANEDGVVDTFPSYVTPESLRGKCCDPKCEEEGSVVRLKCGGCLDARYHSRECQLRHRESHKEDCGPLAFTISCLSDARRALYMDTLVLAEDCTAFEVFMPTIRMYAA